MVKAGYEATWKNKEMAVTTDGERRPIEVRNGTPVLPNEICLKLVDEIERLKGAKIKSAKTEKAEE